METDAGETIWIEAPLWAHRWRRLVILLALVSHHAASGCMIQHLDTLRDRQEQEAYERWQRLAKAGSLSGRSKNLAKGKAATNAPKPMAKGKALSRSTTEVDTRAGNVPTQRERHERPSRWSRRFKMDDVFEMLGSLGAGCRESGSPDSGPGSDGSRVDEPGAGIGAGVVGDDGAAAAAGTSGSVISSRV